MFKKRPIPLWKRSQVAVRDKGICQKCKKEGELKNTYFGFMAFEKRQKWHARGRGASSGIYPNYISFEIDHLIPEYLGGSVLLENLRLLCRSCNRSKGIKN